MEPSATRYHRLVDPDFDSRLKAWVTLLGYKTYHYRMQWLRLHTHPKRLAHQCGAHKMCVNRFTCSGWAYGLDFWLTITNLGNVCGGNGVNGCGARVGGAKTLK